MGGYVDATGEHGFLDTGGRFTFIDVAGAAFVFATGINNSGQIAGVFSDPFVPPNPFDHGFVETADSFTRLVFS